MYIKTVMMILILLITTSYVRGAEPPMKEQFSQLAEEFVFTTLSFSPTGATQVGLHERTDANGKQILFDELLDDFSPTEIARQRAYYEGFRRRLHRIAKNRLDTQTQVDYELLENAVALALFSIDDEQFYRRKPQLYVENLGAALFSNITLEYADRERRAEHLTARLEKLPAYISQAITNLQASNEIYRKVALEANDGVIGLVKGLGAEFVQGTPAAVRYQQAQPAALAALTRFDTFIREELPKREEFDWRMGTARFDAKWRYYLQVSFSPTDMLRVAEEGMRQTRADMLRLAAPLHDKWFPDHKHDRANAVNYLNEVVGEVLVRIGSEHTNRDELVEQAQRDASEITRFIREKKLLSMIDYSNLRIIPTPEFMRASYGIAGAVFAPALEPKLATFYWVTPIPKEWSDEKVEGRLREYNKYKMLQLTIHEALPGHCVQGEYANRITPPWRRLLRVIYGNTPYIEGWAVYAEHMMEEVGLNGGDATKMRLTALKALLRLYANSIIDIRLHTTGMSGEEAITLMIRDAFQERPEAEGKLQRAQLDYVQLNTYLAGWREWMALRRDQQRRLGNKFSLCRYHDTVLLYGPIPVPKVRQLLQANVNPSADPLISKCD
ncbi:MAG: DUF885 domain-containing protein [Acidobacteriota bacterium]